MPILLEEKIGNGAYANVWRATDKLGRKVAVKVLRRSAPFHFDAMEHAKALARTRHSNVVTVYDLVTVTDPDTGDEVDGIVMELIAGQTLQDRMKEGDFESEEILQISEGLISGLEHIHSVGLVHNDLHSANVLVNESKVTIIDILYTDSLSKVSSGTKEDRIRYDKQQLTILLHDIASHSSLSPELRFRYGRALADSSITFSAMRDALKVFVENTDNSNKTSTKNATLKSLKDSIIQDRHNVQAILKTHLTNFTRKLSQKSIDITAQSVPIDEAIWVTFEEMIECRNEFIETIIYLCEHSRGIELYVNEIIECLQEVAAYADYDRPGIGYSDGRWNDNFKLFIHELFIYLVAALIRAKKYKLVFDITHTTYRVKGCHQTVFSGFIQFRKVAHSIDTDRKNRLKLNLVNPTAHLFRQRAKLADFPWSDVMQADFVLFLISLLDRQDNNRMWFPDTLQYAVDGPSFPLFIDATAKRYFEQIKVMFGVQSRQELLEKFAIAKTIHKSINDGVFEIASAEWISIPQLANFAELESR